LRQFEVKGKEFPTLVVSFLADVKFKELALDGFLLIDCVEIGVEVF
jgi:hypothetical protein